MDKQKIVEVIANVVVALSAVVVAVAAIPGINAWRKQMKGKVEYELSRRYLRAIYKVRDSLKVVRNPYISIGEMEEARKKQGLTEEEMRDNRKMNQAVYSARWVFVSEALSDLEAETREAEVIWGKSAVDVIRPFEKLWKKLFVDLKMFLEGYSGKNAFEINLYDLGEEDDFNKKISDAIEEVIIYLKPHLNLDK